MKAKEMKEILAPHLLASITKHGYEEYKPQQFIKVNNEVLIYIRIYLSKNDLYIWHATYPLCENDIWLGAGAIAGRIPEIEGSLKVTSFESLKLSTEYLDEALNEAIVFQKQRSSIRELEKLIPSNSLALPLFIKGVCLAYLQEYSASKIFLDAFVKIGLDFGASREGAMKILESLQNSTTVSLLETNKSNNIKKLRLKKYLSKYYK